jgi:signal transduction histidine kinase
MYHSLQELLTNIQKHANASQVKIKLDYGRKAARLVVEDNGEGFQVAKAMEKEGHYGLTHIQHRAEVIGARIKVKSKKGKGTRIEIRVPRKAGKDE